MTTYREFFDMTDDVHALMLFVGKAHTHGTLTRQRLMQVVVRCCETVAWRMPDASRTALADVAAWAHGDDGVDLRAIEAAANDAAYAVPYAAYAASYAAEAAANAAYAAKAADAYVAVSAAAASSYVSYAADEAADETADHKVGAALCDVVRDEVTVEEVCSALDVNPDEVMS